MLLDSAQNPLGNRGISHPRGRSYSAVNKVVAAVGIVLTLFYAVSATSFVGFLCAVLITAAALLPVVLWLNRYVEGIPCYPMFAGMYDRRQGLDGRGKAWGSGSMRKRLMGKDSQ